MKAQKFIPVAVIAAVLLAYHNSLTAPFILDDLTAIKGNPSIRRLWPVWQALCPPHGGVTVDARPVLNLSLAVNYALGGLAPWGYHALSLAIHILAGLTLFGIARRTLLRPRLAGRFGAAATPLALTMALIWILHPLQTEAVTYVSQRAESLMGLFYLLTLYGFIRGVESGGTWGEWHTLSVAACLLGMATKEVMVSAPLMVLLYDRTFVAGNFRDAWRQRWRLYAYLAGTWLVLGYLVANNSNRGGTAGFGTTIAWWQYALTQTCAITHYLRLSVWPHPLVFDYGTNVVTGAWQVAPCAVTIALLVIGAAISLWRWPAVGFLACWFFAILAPSSSILPVATQTMAEHRMYLPLAAVVAMVSAGGFTLGRNLFSTRQEIWKMLAWGVSGTVVLVLTILTIQRNHDYRSELSIWQDTVAKCPGNPRAHTSLGSELERAGREQEAIQQYEEAIRLKSDYAEAHNNLGAALLRLGRTQEAVAQCEEAVRIKPDYVQAHINLGNTFFQTGRLQEAIGHYEQALRLEPNSAEAHNNLGTVLLRLNRAPEAIAQYEEAVRIMPDYAGAHFNLALALKQTGDIRGAILHYEHALQIKPDHLLAQNSLARLLATHAPTEGGDPARAIALAEEVCRHTGNHGVSYLDTLAMAYAAGGRFDDAVTTAQKAIELARSAGQTQLVSQIEERLELYRAGQPYREPENGTGSHNP